MLQDKIIDMALSTADPLISADRSRCVRMRFNKSTCSICMDRCRSGAISIEDGISVDTGKCTECMLCLSECPSGCFSAADEDFFALLSRLRKTQNSLPRSVLGCKKADGTEAHEKTGCLGFLSEEHLIALAGYLNKPLYLNLTACGACRNSFIVERLKERIQNARSTFFDVVKRILLAEKKEDLVFEDVSLDRRGFFKALKTMGFTQVAGLIEKSDAEMAVSYTAKKLPLKRNIFNAAVTKFADGIAVADLLSNYAFTVKTGTSCNNCFACVGMCPTGALKIKKDGDGEGEGLLFNSSLCNGCSLCRDFCWIGAITVSKGFSGTDYFDHEICSAELRQRKKLTENLHSNEV